MWQKTRKHIYHPTSFHLKLSLCLSHPHMFFFLIFNLNKLSIRHMARVWIEKENKQIYIYKTIKEEWEQQKNTNPKRLSLSRYQRLSFISLALRFSSHQLTMATKDWSRLLGGRRIRFHGGKNDGGALVQLCMKDVIGTLNTTRFWFCGGGIFGRSLTVKNE